MPALLIKDLPTALHARLKDRARVHRRSMGREALVILEAALKSEGPLSLSDLDRLRAYGARPLTDDLLDHARREGRP